MKFSLMSRLLISPLVILMVVIASSLLFVPRAFAQEIFNGEKGPYKISVGIDPNVPSVGLVHFTVVPRHLDSLLPVEQAWVRITARSSDGSKAYTSLALESPSNPGVYQANLTLGIPGGWDLEIEIETSDLGKTEFLVPFIITGEFASPDTRAVFVWILIILAVLSGVTYLHIKSKKLIRPS